MSTQLTPVITQAGISALIDAKNRGMSARITHVAVGDGSVGDSGSQAYTATDDMESLNHELQRVIVSGGEQIGNEQNQLHLTATVQDEGDNVPDVYPIYEIGFFLETGELFAIYASPDEKLAEKVVGTDFLLAFDLTFTGADAGDIVIDGCGKLETPAARDNILLGPNTVKIHKQAEFDAVFNQGADTVIAANSTIALSPIQGAYEPDDSGRWQRVYEITAFADSVAEPGSKVTCTCVGHGLSEGDDIVILQSQYYNGNYSVTNVSADSFDILAHFVATGTAKWGSINGSAYTTISAFGDSASASGLQTTCVSAGHGLSAGDSLLITQSRYYSGVYTLVSVDTDNFDIDTPYTTGDLADGAWGGLGDEAHNTYNGRPAYILKNSIVLSENVSIIGFNPEDTLVVKDAADTKIKIQGTSGVPVAGIRLQGWSFDGRGGVDSLGGGLTGTANGGAFYLGYCRHSALNCKIINHATSANGGGLFGATGVSHITATDIHYNRADNGGGAYNCDNSTLTVYHCSAGTNGSGVAACNNSLFNLFNCAAEETVNSLSSGGLVVQDNAKIGIGTANSLDSELSVFSAQNNGGLTLKTADNTYNQGIAFRNGGNAYTWYIHRRNTGNNQASLVFAGGTAEADITALSDLLCIHNNSNVGIGTTDPAGKLQIIGENQTANGDTLVLGPITQSNLRLGYHENYSWVQSHGTKPLAINPLDNNVGIGTDSPLAKLSINGGLHVGGDSDPGNNNLLVDGETELTGDVSVPTSNLSFGSSTRQMVNLWNTGYGIGVQGSTHYYRSDHNFAWFKGGTHSNTTFDAGTGGTVQMVIDANGNIGLGATSPDQKLTIKGGGIGFDHNSSDKKLYSPTDGVLEWHTHESAGERAFAVSHQGDQKVYLSVMGSSYFMGGNLGIGTDSPAAKLSVNGGLHVGGDSDPGDNNLQVDGNVEIGGTTKLNTIQLENLEQSGTQQVAGTLSGTNGELYFDQNYHTEFDAFTGGNGGGLAIHSEDGWGAVIDTNNMQWITPIFDGAVFNGYVGIGTGTTAPAAALSIGADGKEDSPDGFMHITSDCILFGGNNSGKESNSAQISAGKHVANSLNIVGMSSGTTSSDRKINLWAEGGLTLAGSMQVNGSVTVTGNFDMDDGELQNVRALQLKDWDDNSGGSDSTYRLLARDGAFMFYNGGVVVGQYGNGSLGNVGTGNLIVEGTTTTSGINVSNAVSSHIDADGALYRYSNNVWLTVDDYFYIRDKAGSARFRFYTNDDCSFRMYAHDNDFKISLDSQQLYFRLDKSQHTGTSSKTISWDGDSNWDSESDRKLKINIKREEGILERLLQLEVKNYQWKGAEGKDPVKIGFIAQDVQPLFPQLVGSITNPDTKEPSLTLKYASFGVLAVGGLRELKAETEAVNAEQNALIETLQKQVQKLEKAYNDLKAQVANLLK